MPEYNMQCDAHTTCKIALHKIAYLCKLHNRTTLRSALKDNRKNKQHTN